MLPHKLTEENSLKEKVVTTGRWVAMGMTEFKPRYTQTTKAITDEPFKAWKREHKSKLPLNLSIS